MFLLLGIIGIVGAFCVSYKNSKNKFWSPTNEELKEACDNDKFLAEAELEVEMFLLQSSKK